MAEYVMLGRRQAIIVVLLCGFFPLLYFLSAAVVGLVTLRRGRNEGLLILLWAMLPAGVMWGMGDATAAFLMLGTFVLAMLLRATMSWQLVILVAVGMGLLAQFSLALQPEYRGQIELLVSEGLQAQVNEGTPSREYTADQVVDLLLSFYGAYHAFMVVICLMIGRWWQALLYNPGGFRQEFHNLRFDPRAMIILLGLILAGLLDISPLDGWLPLLSVAPIFGGLAIAHYTVAKKNLGTLWLVLCYLTLLMMAPAVILLGLADSVLDLRKRLNRRDG